MLNTAFISVFLILCCISLWLWWQVGRRLVAGEAIIEKRFRNPCNLGLMDVAIMFAAWMFGQMLALGLFFNFLGGEGSELEAMEASQKALMIGLVSLGQLIGTGVGLVVLLVRHPSWGGLSLSTKTIADGVKWGILGFGLVVPPILILQLVLTKLVPYQHATFDVLNRDSPLISFVLTWLAAVVAAPICEEIFFRGVLQGWLQRVFAKDKPSLDSLIAGGNDGVEEEFPGSASFPIAAVVVASLVFAMVHWGQGLAPIPLFFFALALGYLYHQTGNLISCVVLHVALNAFSMFWFTMQLAVGDV